jgi:NAD(P)-dependent dehydrogenase (short-subunit alcohol dehydrogenase family)
MNEFQNKVAIVIGGTSGIGRAAAVAYAREGARVVVAGRRAAEGEETVRLLEAQGGEGFFVTTDVSKAAQVKELVERTLQKFGRLDIAFNNAGIEQVPNPFLEQDEETFDRVVDVNAKGVWLSMKYEIPAMLKTGGGVIVNTASVFGVIGIPGNEIYIASKHAVIGLTSRSPWSSANKAFASTPSYRGSSTPTCISVLPTISLSSACRWTHCTPSDALASLKTWPKRPSGFRPASRRS